MEILQIETSISATRSLPFDERRLMENLNDRIVEYYQFPTMHSTVECICIIVKITIINNDSK